MKKRLSGIFAPITTPFHNEKVVIKRLKDNIRKYSQTSLSGFLVLGSNGENKSLTENEKLNILDAVLEAKADHQLVMAGTGFESTSQTIAFSKKAAELGADFVSLLTPSYFKKSLTDESMIRYYSDVADVISTPILVYNAPGFTGMTITPKAIQTISKHPNIVGMKDTSPANIGRYLEVGGDDFDVLAGTINTLFIGLALGASGGVVSLANAFPQACCDLFQKAMDGDFEAARKRHYTLNRLNHSVSGAFGVAGVKFAMEVAGYYGGPPRLPLLPLRKDDKKRIRDAIAEVA